MNKLFRVLRDRRGESMVEILVSTVVFMMLLGALNGAVGFSANAQRKAEELRKDAAELQRSVREQTAAGEDTQTIGFHQILPESGAESTQDAFRVTVKKQTVEAAADDGKRVTFYRFAAKEADTP
ncbi:hypothetical protein [uncultured Agathobaculum sp.]|uniref:hypothetical protein n=1 Tax=uncultured Agathobaculum sp. TaxID=2048140 RepID=UPI00296F0FE4